MTPRHPDEIRIDGRRYVRISIAAAQVGYEANNIRGLLKRKPGVIRHQRRGYLIYVCLSDVIAWRDRRNNAKTKVQLIAEWWNSHPMERAQVSDGYDLVRRLKRDDIHISSTLARMFLHTHRTHTHKVTQVLHWIEAVPSRRKLTGSQIRSSMFKEFRLNFPPSVVKRAVQRFDAKHGAPVPPFNMADYLCTKHAADAVGVSRSLITGYVNMGRLSGTIWRGTMYILKSSLESYFSQKEATT